jgi:hypothetical protein
MIKVENILMDVFSGMDPVADHNPLLFHFGEQKELDSVIQTRQDNGEYTYPLLWYLMPGQLSGFSSWVEGELRFVLAHNTDLNWRNDQRFEQVFNGILQPNFDLVLKKLDKSHVIEVMEFSDGSLYRFTNYPNYGNPTTFEGKKQAKQINYWDAIGFTLNLRIHNDHEC